MILYSADGNGSFGLTAMHEIYQGADWQCLKGDVSTVPYRVQDMRYSADLAFANLVDTRMLCFQSSVMRKVIYREMNNSEEEKLIKDSSDKMKSKNDNFGVGMSL